MKFAPQASQWLTAMEHVAVDGQHLGRTGDVETLLVVLRGTFDILAGGGSWPARGVRTSPVAGKPVAVFLPPNTSFGLENGSGEILLVSGMQPAQHENPGEASIKKPLLAMAGSGKAFDPATGEWKLAESFPAAPQALLPRHIEVEELDGCTIRRVFPFGYKALCLTLDELVLPANCATRIPAPNVADYPAELALYYDTPGELSIDETTVSGQGFLDQVTVASTIHAKDADAYVAVAYAGPKLGS